MVDLRPMIVSEVSGAAEVHGVHGAAGLTRWKCLAGRRQLAGEWEAVEWASIPPGGLSGEHRHTRTEEVYFILRGEGEFLLNGTAHTAGPGSLLLTGTGSVHGLRNTGTSDLDWLVIEVPTPETSEILRGRRIDGLRTERKNRVNARIHDLSGGGSVDPNEVFTGPLNTLEIQNLRGEASWDLSSEGAEHTFYVLGGEGRVTCGPVTSALAPGTAVTLPLGAKARITAGPGGLSCFHAVLKVPS